MWLELLYGRIVAAALGTLLGVCALLATAKFIRSRARLLSPLVRAHGALFAVMMGLMAMVGMFRSFGKLPQNYGIMELWNYGNEALGIDGEAQFHNASMSQSHNSIISESDISNGWRVVETRESREIVGRDAFGNPQMHMSWLARGGYRDKTRIAPYGWSFPWRDGILDGITVLSRGELRPNIRTLYFPRPFDAPLAVVPSFNWRLLPGGVSNVFWHAVSPSNSLVVTWENSPVNRDVNSLTNFQAELFADGSFVYRYDDRTVGYAPVFPFDWDDDGLENSVDPEPLVAGPDAHGTNVEWYNNVCSNVYEAVETGEPANAPAGMEIGPRDLAPPGISLSPRTSDVNTNAYYFVEVVASRGPAPIWFTAEGESRLGNPVVVARAGETNHVPLLMGVEYAVTSTVPLTISVPDNASAAMSGINEGRSFSVKWPLNFVFDERLTSSGREYDISVDPFDPGGMFSWEAGHTPRLLSSGPECSCMAMNGRTVVFNCSQNCSCRGDCGLKDFYLLENAMFDVSGGQCRCGFDDPQPPVQTTYEPLDGASISVEFDKAVVIFESAFEERPGRWRNRRSTRVRLTVSAYGGPLGGMVFLSPANLGKLTPVGGEAAFLPPTLTLGPHQTFFTSGVYEGCEASENEEDVEVSGSIIGNTEFEALMSTRKLTVVRAEVRPQKTAPENGCVNRHEFGVREIVDCECFPKINGEQWVLAGGGTDDRSPEGNMRAESSKWVFRCPLTNTTSRLEVSHGDVVYRPIVTFVEPDDVVAEHVDYFFPEARASMCAGDIALKLKLYIYPKRVNFEEIALEEVPWEHGGAVSGYYARPDKASGRYHDRNHGAGTWRNVVGGNYWGTDGVGSRNIADWSAGVKTWDIPIGWNIKGTSGESEPIKCIGDSDTFQANFEITPTGTYKVKKFRHWVSIEMASSPDGPDDGRILLDGNERDRQEDFARWAREGAEQTEVLIWP